MSNMTFSSLPSVSVIMPIRNEAVYIEQTMRTLLAQDYPRDRLEILLVDGMSIDDTRAIISRVLTEQPDFPATILDNPRQIVPTGLNIALRHAQGEIIVRMDAHCEYPPDFITQVVLLREETDADNAGGILIPVGTSYTQRAICSAFRSPVSVGGNFQGHALGGVSGLLSGVSKDSYENLIHEVDTVHGGCWRRERLFEVGLFDEEMVRNQDDELSFRLRKAGGHIIQSQAIQAKYFVRDSFRKLFLQFAQYGYWKVRVIRRHPRQASVRHVVPSLLLLTLIGFAIMALFSPIFLIGFMLITGSYLLTIIFTGLLEARRGEYTLWPGIVLAILAIHFGFGWGFLIGILQMMIGPLPTDSIFKQMTR
jgi:succinoglycan biosynthesis protein ExoA